MASNGYSSIALGDSGNWVDVRNAGDSEVIKLTNPALQARVYINDADLKMTLQILLLETGDRAYIIVVNVPEADYESAQAEVDQVLQTFTPLPENTEVSQSLPQ